MSLKRILALLVTAALLAGCGSRDNGKNKNKDLPEPPAKEKPKG
jgi:hypothetical protein